MKIDPKKPYTGLQAQKLLGIKSRQYISKYVKEGKLLAIHTGEGSGNRYVIFGDWIIDFKDRYKNGLVKGKTYTKAERKSILEKAIKNLN